MHGARVEWNRNDDKFTDGRYSRAHTWSFDGGLSVVASSSPSVVPVPMSNPMGVDPEEGFVASLSSCHMLWFIDLARRAGHIVDRYVDEATGELTQMADGRSTLSKVTLKPLITFSQPVSSEELNRLHHEAHHQCFLANAVKCEMVIVPRNPD